MWIIFAFCSAVFAGLTSILAKCGMKDMNSNVATFLRTIVVLFFSWIMVFVTGVLHGIWDITIKSLIFLVLSGLSTGASWLCYFKALQIGNVNKVTPVDKCSTVLSMIMAFIILGEPVGWLKVLCMILILAGTFLMIQKVEDVASGEDSTTTDVVVVDGRAVETRPVWLLYACGSAVFAALTTILGKIGIENVDSTLGTAIRTIVVLLMAWQVVMVTGKQEEIRRVDKFSGVFLVLSGCATGASWLCYYRALQLGPASVVAPIDKLSILITIAFSWLVFHEKLNKRSGIGLGLIVAGTLLLLL